MTRPACQITLTSNQRQELDAILRRGTRPAHQSRHARILLEADTAVPHRRRRTDATVGERCGVSARTVARVRRTFAEEGLKVALEGRKRTGGRPKLDANQEARLVALACSEPPAGYAQWSLRLLARHVELVELPPLSPDLVRRTLKKRISSPGGWSAG
jgi:Homeodomain-like domain